MEVNERNGKFAAKGPAHATRFRVRYAEIDRMGFAYHGHFLAWFEVARAELFRSLGHSYSDLEKAGYLLPVQKADLVFHAPAFYDDELEVTARLTYMSKCRLNFAYEVRRPADETLIAEGNSLLFCTDRDGNLAKIPPFIQALAQR